MLARAGAAVNAKDRYGFSPLHYAALRGNHSETVELLNCDGINIEVHLELYCVITGIVRMRESGWLI